MSRDEVTSYAGALVPHAPHVAHEDPAVQLLLDRRAIEDLFYAYAAGVDRRDFDLVSSCFAPDVHGPFGGTERRDRSELIEYIAGVRFFHTTMHMMGNTLIDVRGDDARLDTDAMVKHSGLLEDGRDYQLNMSGGGYRERLERRGDRDGPGGGWCIVERALSPARVPAADAARGPFDAIGSAAIDPAVRWLLDRAEIHDLLTGYARGVDARSYAPVRACFAKAFHANYLGHEFEDIEALTEFIRGVEHFGFTRHFFSRPVLAVRDDVASSEVAAILVSRGKDDPKGRRERTSAARYRDELVREDGRWRVRERRHGVPIPPLQAEATAPRSADPAIQYLLDRAEIEDLVVAQARDAESEESDDRAHHFVGNQLARIDGDRADIETYVYRLERASGGDRFTPWHEHAERWEDLAVRDGEGWRVVEHRVCSNRTP